MSETTVPRGRLSRSARRAQLLDAARDVFAAQGYHAAAMDDIAERAGVSKPVLYQHFPGKLELYQALLTTYADELVGQVEAALSATAENEERVQAAVAAYFDFVAGDGQGLPADLRVRPARRRRGGRRGRDEPLHREGGRRRSPPTRGWIRPRARLLAVGLVGLSQVAAQYWLDSEQTVGA